MKILEMNKIPSSDTWMLCRQYGYKNIECGLYRDYQLIGGKYIDPIDFDDDWILMSTKKYYPKIIQKLIIWKNFQPQIQVIFL